MCAVPLPYSGTILAFLLLLVGLFILVMKVRRAIVSYDVTTFTRDEFVRPAIRTFCTALGGRAEDKS